MAPGISKKKMKKIEYAVLMAVVVVFVIVSGKYFFAKKIDALQKPKAKPVAAQTAPASDINLIYSSIDNGSTQVADQVINNTYVVPRGSDSYDMEQEQELLYAYQQTGQQTYFRKA